MKTKTKPHKWMMQLYAWMKKVFFKKSECNIWSLGTNIHARLDVHINENNNKYRAKKQHAQVPPVLQVKSIQSCKEEWKISSFFQLMCVIPWNPLRYWLRYQTKSIVVSWICEYALPQFYIHMPMNECYESLLIQHKSMRTSTSHISTCLCGFSLYLCMLICVFFYPFLQHFDFLGISHDFASNMIPSGYEHWCCYFLLCSFDSYYMEWLQCSRLKSIRSMYRT